MNEEGKNDSKLIQQLKIEGAASNVTIVQQQNVNTDFRGKDAHRKRRRFHVMEKLLWDLLDALPDPKLKALEELTISVVNGHFQNQKNTAGYLGISQMKVSKTLRAGACDIKERVASAAWKALPTANKEAMELIETETAKAHDVVALEETQEEKLARLVAEGKIIIRNISREDL